MDECSGHFSKGCASRSLTIGSLLSHLFAYSIGAIFGRTLDLAVGQILSPLKIQSTLLVMVSSIDLLRLGTSQ
jgi:hypothetical protein